MRLLPSFNVILSSVSIIRYALPAVQQIQRDLNDTFVYQRNISTDNKIRTTEFKTLTLKDVSFNYASSEIRVISNLSLEIYRHQSIGLIGGSGAGKTTLVDLILGLLKPSNGEIFVNNEPIRNNPETWWSMVAYIPQSPFLSDDTIKRNIALGIDDKSIDEMKIDVAIAASQLESFVEQLPNGLNTMIGDRGIRLSGGQRQRIAIARALYFDRQVLIFDEATSSLDSNTENEIVAAIEALHGSKTMIIIAHRMSTLAYCDRIIEIKQGRVSELQFKSEKMLNGSLIS
jgi:ABC-type multidrug transport system fused ATPase/permease subunit